MRLSDVLEAPQLRIRALLVEDGALERAVNWTFTTDLVDPSRYLIQGQLVMTGMVWRRSAEDSETFVAALAGSGSVALMAGEGLFGSVPEDLVAACRRHRMPLFAVPADISFAAITAYISNTLANDRVTRMATSLKRQRELLTDVYRGHLLDDLITRASVELGRPIWVLSATGRHVVEPVEPLPAEALDQVVRAGLTASRFPVSLTVPGGGGLIAFSVAGLAEHRTTAWFVVMAKGHPGGQPQIVDTAHELTAVAGLYRGQRISEIVASSALVDRVVELIGTGSEQPETALLLRQLGLAADQRCLVVVAELVDRPDLQPLVQWLLTDAVRHLGAPVVGRDGEARVVAIVPVSSGGTASSGGTPPSDGPAPGGPVPELAVLTTALQRLAPGLDKVVLNVGVSPVARVSELSGALRSARFALALPATGDQGPGADAVRVNGSSDLTSAVQLLAAVPDHLRRAFVARVLGPVVEHDARYNSQLVATLATFLTCGGSWVRTAELTHLHLNTVRYRIGRVEDLTGRDLSQTVDRVDFYLALQLG